MTRKRRLTGKFWPWVRERIWIKAEEMHAADFYIGHTENITKPTRSELRAEGYFHQAKLAVLREVNRAQHGYPRIQDDFEPPTEEEWEAMQRREQR